MELGRELINHADRLAERATARASERPGFKRCGLEQFRAEQTALLIRLAVDSGQRRSELAAVKVDDLEGRVLTVE